ncbi:MAG: sulfite exporter TauE/SafE family protein [Thermoplasmatales archaeon]
MIIFLEAIIFLSVALVIGVIGNIAGIGGGIIIMIVLLFFFKVDPVTASGMSLVTIFVSSVFGTISNMKQQAVDSHLMAAIGVPASLGVLVGSYLVTHIKDSSFNYIFSFVSIAIGLFSLLITRSDRKNKIIEDGTFAMGNFKSNTNLLKGKYLPAQHLLAFVAGVAGGFLGIGIGGIVGTYLTAIRKINPKIAFSTTLSAMVFTSLIGSSYHLASIKPATELLTLIISLAIGAAMGALVGSNLSSRIQFVKLRLAQGYIIVSLGLVTLLFSLLT